MENDLEGELPVLCEGNEDYATTLVGQKMIMKVIC